MQRNYKAAIARAYVRVVGVNREWTMLVFEVFLPLLSVAAFAFIYISAAPPGLKEPLALRVIIGGAMTAFWINMLWGMASQFYFEKESGNLELFFVAPISRMSILAGMAAGGMFNTTVRAIATIFLGALVFGVSFAVSSPLMLVAIFAFTMLSLYGMGMMFASLFMLYGREAWHTSNLLQEPVFLVSGFYFPPKYLQDVSAVGMLFASVIPMTLGLDAMNQIIGGPMAVNWGLMPVTQELAALAFMTLVFIGLARLCLAYMERLAKKEARLTLKQQ
jgi:ABC-2 type transport system permease protein